MTTQKVNKTEIGLVQLRRAIQLYNSRDYISSITLAGASDEIFGQFAILKKGHNTLDGDKHVLDQLAEKVNKEKIGKGKLKKKSNHIKNALKHHNSSIDEFVLADFQLEAELLIDSAIRNYWIAFDNPPKDRIINKYVEKEWT